jgi:hypothetical protein
MSVSALIGRIAIGFGAFILVMVLLLGTHAGLKSYGRYQARQDAHNQTIVHKRLVTVEEQKRQIRVIEAHGIAESQDIINATLTPLYLQHEAIQAMEMWAESDSNSVVYLPVGEGGLPLIKEVTPEE